MRYRGMDRVDMTAARRLVGTWLDEHPSGSLAQMADELKENYPAFPEEMAIVLRGMGPYGQYTALIPAETIPGETREIIVKSPDLCGLMDRLDDLFSDPSEPGLGRGHADGGHVTTGAAHPLDASV